MREFEHRTGDELVRPAKRLAAAAGDGGGGTFCKIIAPTENDWEYHVHEYNEETLAEVSGGLQVNARNTEEIGNANLTHAILQGTGGTLPDRYVMVVQVGTRYVFTSYPGAIEIGYHARVISLTPAGCVCEVVWDKMAGPAIVETPTVVPVCEQET